MTYPDGRHAERPTGTAQPYAQDRQQWPGPDETERPAWPDGTGPRGWLGEPEPQGWAPEPDQRGWTGQPDQQSWNGQPDQQSWNGQPDQPGWNDGPPPRGWNEDMPRQRYLDEPQRPADGFGEPDRRGGWLGEQDRATGRPVDAEQQQQQPRPGPGGPGQDPWFPRQRPPSDVPQGAYPDTDWLSPPRTPPAPAGWAPPEEREASSQPVSFTAGEEVGLPALLRGRALDRLIAVNASHASHAADKVRTKDDLCEHAIALFSFDLTDKTFPLSTATRLSLSDDGNTNLVEMLSSLANVAEYKVAQAAEHGRRWDPRIPLTGLVNRSEELPPDMVYLGIGVSTLDTPEMAWRSMKGTVDRFSGLHLRGQGYLYLDDGTAAQFVRAAQLSPQSGQHEISASNMLFSHYSWKRRPDLLEHANQRTHLIWEQIRRLHQALKIATAP